MNKRLKLAAAACLVAGAVGAGNARAQGIPVIDAANLIQTIMQVMNDVTKINNQVQQITQLQSQINSINGMRNLGNISNNPMLRNYVPAEAYTYLNAVNTSGYSGLNATAKGLRDEAWSTTAWTWAALRAPTARRHWLSPISRKACCRTR